MCRKCYIADMPIYCKLENKIKSIKDPTIKVSWLVAASKAFDCLIKGDYKVFHSKLAVLNSTVSLDFFFINCDTTLINYISFTNKSSSFMQGFTYSPNTSMASNGNQCLQNRFGFYCSQWFMKVRPQVQTWSIAEWAGTKSGQLNVVKPSKRFQWIRSLHALQWNIQYEMS